MSLHRGLETILGCRVLAKGDGERGRAPRSFPDESLVVRQAIFTDWTASSLISMDL